MMLPPYEQQMKITYQPRGISRFPEYLQRHLAECILWLAASGDAAYRHPSFPFLWTFDHARRLPPLQRERMFGQVPDSNFLEHEILGLFHRNLVRVFDSDTCCIVDKHSCSDARLGQIADALDLYYQTTKGAAYRSLQDRFGGVLPDNVASWLASSRQQRQIREALINALPRCEVCGEAIEPRARGHLRKTCSPEHSKIRERETRMRERAILRAVRELGLIQPGDLK